MNKVASVAANEINEKLKQKAKHWIRPPFAIEELDFILGCTRCDKCVEACPHDIIFPLSMKNGLDAVGTPALDLINKGCKLCQDWPCVAACEPQVLKLPDSPFPEVLVPEGDVPETGNNLAQSELALRPKLAKVEVDSEVCLPYRGPECGACRDSCPIENALVWEGNKPTVDAELCVGCALCREACIVEPKAILMTSL